MNLDNEPYEILIQTVTGEKTTLKGEGQTCIKVILPGLQSNDVVKLFSIFDSAGRTDPVQFALSRAIYTKWQ